MAFLRHPFKAMGTPCELLLYGSGSAHIGQAVRAITADVERLEAAYSRYRSDSLLSTINAVAAQGGEITVDAETAGLLDYAAACHAQSDGLFDITSGILRRAWDFRSGRLPDPTQVDDLLNHVGWHQLHWASPVLEFPHPGLELDLGGVVKEYAVDRAAVIALECGIRHGMVNLGGDVRVIGPHPDGTPWRIGIRDPGHPGSTVRHLELSQGALASSGDYERCIRINGRRYGHVLSPRTGWPVSHLAAVSVVADLCVIAGSAATIGMLKAEQGPQWLSDLGLPCLWVTTDGAMGGSLAQPVTTSTHGSVAADFDL